jgi:flagellar motility protein MotE (MotC chaperone)
MRKSAGKDVHLLPAVIGVAALLFVLKAGGLAFSANAAQTPAPAAKPAAAAAKPADPTAAINAAMPIPKADPNAPAAAAEKPSLPPDLVGGVTAAQMDVLTSLSDRRGALDERQRQLELQAGILSASEKRVDQKIAELKAIQTKIEAMLDQRDEKDAAQLDSLVRIYSAMKPKDAARIFDKLDGQVRISVAGKLKPDVMAGILANLPADMAQKLTVELATRYRMPTGVTVPPLAPVAAPQAGGTPQANAATPAPANSQQAPPKAGG